MFPGKKAGTAYSFSNPTNECREHIVTRAPDAGAARGKYKLTMAEYANIEHGEHLGELPGKIHHTSHRS